MPSIQLDVVKLIANSTKGNDIQELYREYQENMPDVLEEYGIKHNIKQISEKIWSMFIKQTFRAQDNSVEDISFNIVQSTHPLEGLLRFTSNVFGIETFEEFRQAIGLSLQDKFNDFYQLLTMYVKETGSAEISKEEIFQGKPLGQSVHNARMHIKSGNYPPERREMLEALPGWKKEHFFRNKPLSHTQWMELLKKYVIREGHANVPLRRKEEGFSLGNWVVNKRIKQHTMSLEERVAFESLPGWSWDPNQDSLEKGLAMLERFASREGHCQVPCEHVQGEVKLGYFVINLRSSGKHVLDDNVRNRLNAIPVWTRSITETHWGKGLLYLRKFIVREGHSNVPARHIENRFPLGAWTGRQRTAYRANPKRLHEEKIQVLESLPHWSWEPQDVKLTTKLDWLIQFTVREGRAVVPQDHIEDGFALGRFVCKLRETREKLNSETVIFLETLPGWTWNAFENAWEQKFALLRDFHRRNGHVNVSSRDRTGGISLGQWLQAQRRKKDLSEGRKNRLRSLGVVFHEEVSQSV